MDYKARFYSPYLNHFIQPDSIVPYPFNPQAWNRFGYVHNNPINFNDPSGHARCNEEGECWEGSKKTKNIHLGDYKQSWKPKPKVCSSSICNPSGIGAPPFPPSATLHDTSLEELGTPYENQGNTNFCGAYSISMARSLYYQSCNSSTGADVAGEIWWNSNLGMGVPPSVYEGYIQSNMPDAVIEHYTYATMTDLKLAISQDKIVIVTISYDNTHDILFKPVKDLTIGHYMVAVGYDENSVYLLNPASRNPGVDTWLNNKFTGLWQNNSSFIIPPGTMFTISHP